MKAMQAMCKFIRKYNDWIFGKLNKFKISGLFSIIDVTMAMTQIFFQRSNKKLAWDRALGEGKRQKLGWNDKQTNYKQLVSKASQEVDWGERKGSGHPLPSPDSHLSCSVGPFFKPFSPT